MNEENTTPNRPAVPAETEPQGGESLELIPPEQLKEDAKAVYERIAARQKEAKETFDAINGQAGNLENLFSLLKGQLESLIQDFDTLEAQLKTAQYQKKLGDNYAAWFAALYRIQSSSNPYDKNTELNDTLINLSRELSRQSFDHAAKQREYDDILRKIEEAQGKLDRIQAENAEAVRKAEQDKKEELAGIESEIDRKRKELEDLKREIEQEGKKRVEHEAASEADFDGFTIPESPAAGRIYLCGEYDAAIDITAKQRVNREDLLGLDPDANPGENVFRYMGRPQIVIRMMPDGRILAKSGRKRLNKVDGALLSCEEDTELHQGATIEMTDKNGDIQTVKLYIAL